MDGKSTPYHEMGHIYAEKRGIPSGFEEAAKQWHKEAKADMLKSVNEAWAEAWGAYHTGNVNLPEYIAQYIEKATEKPLAKSVKSGIIKTRNISSRNMANGLRKSPQYILNDDEIHQIIDKTDDDGKVLQRRKYGSDGKATVDFDVNDHGFPHTHPTGAHKHTFDHSKKNPHSKPLPLTNEELAENSDIIKRGENYHDEE